MVAAPFLFPDELMGNTTVPFSLKCKRMPQNKYKKGDCKRPEFIGSRGNSCASSTLQWRLDPRWLENADKESWKPRRGRYQRVLSVHCSKQTLLVTDSVGVFLGVNRDLLVSRSYLCLRGAACIAPTMSG